MVKNINDVKKLCQPSFIYFIVSMISLALIAIDNIRRGNFKIYCLGNYECNVENTWIIFIFKFLYVIFWTFILNTLCKSGYTQFAWLILLLPILLLFVVLGLLC